jgi:hypothetical protein
VSVIISLKAANALVITEPLPLLGRAEEVTVRCAVIAVAHAEIGMDA